MSETNPKSNDSEETPKEETPESVFSAVGQVNNQLAAIETFIARRFDEISMEINATSQQIDMSEEGIIGKFGEILGILHAISFSGDGKTAANAGVELDAVVQLAEDAANKILDASDRIMEKLDPADSIWADSTTRKEALEDIASEVGNIMMACSFQDITGQRIRKTLDNLKVIEDRLGTALEKMGIEVDAETPEPSEEVSTDLREGASQDDIDDMFN